MFAHISIGVTDLKKSKDFYDSIMGALGYGQCAGAIEESYIGYGYKDSWFIINVPLDEDKPVVASNGTHFCFQARGKREVDLFYKVAIENGARDAGAPGIRSHYADDYYAAYVLDPDGHKIEAVAYVSPN
jgi:catechol 2,3-dioxygenase-like lactoylglutathione lyase family enzyme